MSQQPPLSIEIPAELDVWEVDVPPAMSARDLDRGSATHTDQRDDLGTNS